MTRAWTALLAGMVLLAGAAPLAGSQNSPRVAILEQDGWAAIRAGNGSAAADAFREAIKLDPEECLAAAGRRNRGIPATA